MFFYLIIPKKEVRILYHVLIVEPQEFSRNNLLKLPVWNKNTGSRTGFVCTEIASNGKEALEIIRSGGIDLILTEINLAFIDGLQLLKQIHIDNKPPLVVFISDIVTFAYAREGFVYGAFDYLPKPVSASDMEMLFDRAATELDRLSQNNTGKSIAASIRVPMEHIRHISDEFMLRNPNALKSFRLSLHKLYNEPFGDAQTPDRIISKLFTTLIEDIYSKNNWLSLYIPENYHTKGDYFEIITPEDFMNFYSRKFSYLFEAYCSFRPKFTDDTVSKIYQYLLEHPEEDLSLSTIAGKFYLNHTYLSSLFSRKTEGGYSKLVTAIKMKRAEYLIQYTSLSLEDIANQLGYKDFRHFLNIYKKATGKAASEYIRNEAINNDYSI